MQQQKIMGLGLLAVLLALMSIGIDINTQQANLQGLVAHSAHAGFSSPESGFVVADNLVRVQDEIIYHRGYYSIDGADWVPFSLQGNSFKGSNRWLSSSASATVPLFGQGEHYILAYSCTTQNNNWNCYGGRWQLYVIDNKEVSCQIATTPFASIIAIEATEYDANYEPLLTLDGNTASESRWSGENDGARIAYEFDQVILLDHINIAFHKGNERHSFFSIETSLDGENWQRQLDHSQSADTTLGQQLFTFGPVQAKYVRIVGHGNDGTYSTWNSYTEVSINCVSVANNVDVTIETSSCTAESYAITCEGKCGSQLNNCNTPINCGTCEGGPVTQGDIELIFWQDFQDNPTGGYAWTEILKDWNDPDRHFQEDVRIRQEGDNIFMRSTFPAGGEYLSNGGPGFIVYDKLPLGYDELYFTYKLRFSSGYATQNIHGKLPGLMGDKRAVGGSHLPDGTNGFSTRYMFHQTALRFYIYHMNQWNATWYRDLYYRQLGYYPTGPIPGEEYVGESLILDNGRKLSSGTWHEVTQRVVMNDVGKSNGIVEGYIDGKLVAQRTNMQFRTVDTLQIDRLDLAHFLGGGGDLPAVDVYVDFDDFALFVYKTDADVPRGNEPSAPGRQLTLPTTPTTGGGDLPPLEDATFAVIGDSMSNHFESDWVQDFAETIGIPKTQIPIYAVGGDSCGSVYNQLVNDVSDGTNYLFSTCGVNAFRFNDNTEWYERIYNTAKSKGIDHIYMSTMPPWNRINEYSYSKAIGNCTKMKNENQWLKNFAAQHSDLTVVDMWTQWHDPSGSPTDCNWKGGTTYSSDGVHPTALAYKEWGEAYAEVFN